MKKALFIAVFLALPLVSSASIDANLKYGSIGTEVSELQEFLVTKGFLNTQPTGNFYSLTLAAVKAYQTSVNVPNTGYVGPMTRAAINTELAVNLKDSNQEEAAQPTPTPMFITPNPTPTPVIPSPAPAPSPTPITSSSGPVTVRSLGAIPVPLTIDVVSYATTTVCQSKNVDGIFPADLPEVLATLQLSSSTNTPLVLRSNDSISITARSSAQLDSIFIKQAGGYEFWFPSGSNNNNKTVNLTQIGTGGTLSAMPVQIETRWSGDAFPKTLDLTINSITLADGTKVGGLPLTLSGLTVTACQE